LATLVEVIPPDIITQAINRSQSRDQRRRKLPTELMAVARVVLALFAGAILCEAVRKTLQGPRLRADLAGVKPAGKGGICTTRYH
jgi:hypothetical protein